MNDRDIEDTRMPPDEREAFTCALCEDDFDWTGLEVVINDNVVCDTCAEVVSGYTKGEGALNGEFLELLHQIMNSRVGTCGSFQVYACQLTKKKVDKLAGKLIKSL